MNCQTAFSRNGPLAKAMQGRFEPRPEQGRMADAVAEAMEHRSHVLVEAGTGIGKSFAYLVPAMLRVATSNETVIIATNTISLQEQLVEKDIPLLTNILFPTPDGEDDSTSPVRPVLVKGRGNYVSIRRLKLASERQERLLADGAARRSLEVIQDWAYATLDGTLSTLPTLERPGVWDKVQSDSGNCMGRRCPTYSSCFYQKARAQMEQANLLVCNHALFFSDLALRSQEAGFLPAYHHVILDEAHGVEDAASDHFGISLAEGRVVHLLTSLYNSKNGKGYLANVVLTDPSQVSRAIMLVEQATNATRAFFESLAELVRNQEAPASTSSFWKSRGPLSGTARIRHPGAVKNVLTQAFRDLSLNLKTLREMAKLEADQFELNGYAARAELVATDAEALVSQLVPASAYWIEASGGDDSSERASWPRLTFACAPIEVRDLLKQRLFAGEFSVTLTSATLATRVARAEESNESSETAFAHAMERLGCEGAKALQLGSPFDYAKQVRFLVYRDLPAPQPDHPSLSPLSTAILHHVRATNGGAFVLFTSFSQLNACASDLAGPLAEYGLPLLAQGRDGPRSLILKRFRESESSVLFGAASFWQGVDVRGSTLRNVIITKLPFDPPERPMTQARSELIQSRGGNPFMQDSLPRAVIRFKQGFGRLIRSHEDSGRVVVLDPRLITARYGRIFINALPDGLQVQIIEKDQ